MSWRLADGLMQCRFSRAVAASSPETHRFGLDRRYFLFLASGQAQHGNARQHSAQAETRGQNPQGSTVAGKSAFNRKKPRAGPG